MNTSGDVLRKLHATELALTRCSKTVSKRRGGVSASSEKKLADLIEGPRNDESMVDLLDVKLQLNWEMEKQEAYWEQ